MDEFKKYHDCEYVILVPEYEKAIYESLEDSLSNLIIIEEQSNDDSITNLLAFINSSKNLKQIILVNYIGYYTYLLQNFQGGFEIKWFLTNPVASYSNGGILYAAKALAEYHDRGLFTSVAVLDDSLYELLKLNDYKVNKIYLDILVHKKSVNYHKDTIGVISNDFNPNHSFYNILTSIKLNKTKLIKGSFNMPATLEFLNKFDIRYEDMNDLDDLIGGNEVNVYVNFTNTNNQLILKSIDYNVPIILGNTNIFDDYPNLKEQLVLKSDDDVVEIAAKIKNVSQNRKEIVSELKKFRSEYTKKSKTSIQNYLKV